MVNRQSVSDRRVLLVATAAVVIAILVILAAVTSAGGSDDNAESPSPEASGTSSATPSTSTGATADATEAPTSSSPSAAETPAPSGTAASGSESSGSLETVPVEELVVKDPVDLDDVGKFGTGLSVRVVRTEAVAGESKVRGEIAGPAVRVTVKATNNTDEEISLARSQVEVTYGETRNPGVVLSGPGVKPFPASLAPGESARATYVYAVPVDERELVQIVVFYSTDAPVVVFEGPVR